MASNLTLSIETSPDPLHKLWSFFLILAEKILYHKTQLCLIQKIKKWKLSVWPLLLGRVKPRQYSFRMVWMMHIFSVFIHPLTRFDTLYVLFTLVQKVPHVIKKTRLSLRKVVKRRRSTFLRQESLSFFAFGYLRNRLIILGRNSIFFKQNIVEVLW